MKDPDQYDLIVRDGELVIRSKICDCKPSGFGFVKVADGKWGRPCCRRPVNMEQWRRWQRIDNERSQCERDKEE